MNRASKILALPLVVMACGPEATRVVVLDDNLGASPSYRTSYVGLLEANDDALFPSFEGRSLDGLYGGGAELIRLGRGGNSYRSTARSNEPFCTCTDECDEPTLCLATNEVAPTKLIVQLGSNDLLGTLIRMMGSASLREDYSAEIEAFRADVRAVLALAKDSSRFATEPELFVVNVYDPTDGEGDVAELARSLVPVGIGIDIDALTPKLVLGVLAEGDEAIRSEAEVAGATLVDVRTRFLGHGFHHDDDENAYYDAADPSAWMRGIFDPTLRGAHELRRVLWQTLSGEQITGLPPPLPPESLLGLPAVPDHGWAKAVTDANITKQLWSEEYEITFENDAADVDEILGPPAGADDIVAIGVLGAYIVVDLGADTTAIDGEGPDIVVLEFGALSGGTPEPYRVYASKTPDGPFVRLADAQGEAAVDLAESGLDSARYVKIESLASEFDVLNGLGSPLAPGGEIDAVGAVYPGPAR